MSSINNNKNKVSFVWVLVVLLITVSMAFAGNVAQVNQKSDVRKDQDELNFPVLKNWPAGNGEDAVWVDPTQSMAPVGMDDIVLEAPIQKINFDANQPITKMSDPKRINKSVAKIELFGWN